jgi:hypothetical protein
LGLPHLVLTALFGALFMAANYVGLRPNDLWCHVAFGQWILDHGSLPAEDPFLAYSQGMPVMNGAWLSQLLLAKVYAIGGGELLSTLFAGTLLAAFVLFGRAFYLRTQSLAITVGALAFSVLVGWSRLWTIRPEVFGTLCFSLLLWLVAGREGRSSSRHRLLLFSAAPLFALWASLHGSFVCGLAVLGCQLLGTAVDVAWRHQDWQALLRSRAVRRWLLITELAALGTLFNPEGMDLLVWTVSFAGSPNLRDVAEWQSLSFAGVGGFGFSLSLVTMLFVLRHSRRRVHPADILLMAVFTTAAVLGVRMIGWYAAILAYVLAPHAAEILARWRQRWAAREGSLVETGDDGPCSLPQGCNFRYTLACLLLVWICFALSPSSHRVLGGPGRTPEQLYQEDTPLELTEYLRSSVLPGQIFNPQHWGDWILVNGNPGRPIFITTMIHNVPRRVWEDYMRVSTAGPGWERTLHKYRVETVIVDKRHQPLLAAVLKRSQNWRVRHEDDRALLCTWRAESARRTSEAGDAG